MDCRPILRKLRHPLLTLDGPVDPLFLSKFDSAVHETRMYDDLDLSHLPLDVQDQVYSLVCEFWLVFGGKGYAMPVLWIITSVFWHWSFCPIAAKKILYGDNETVLMPTCIAKLYLYEVGHIWQLHYDEWLFQALLAPKPHQDAPKPHQELLAGTFGITYPISNYFSVRHRCP